MIIEKTLISSSNMYIYLFFYKQAYKPNIIFLQTRGLSVTSWSFQTPIHVGSDCYIIYTKCGFVTMCVVR